MKAEWLLQKKRQTACLRVLGMLTLVCVQNWARYEVKGMMIMADAETCATAAC